MANANEREQELLNYYQQKRIKGQLTFYYNRSKESGGMDAKLRIVSGILMLVTGGLAALITAPPEGIISWGAVLLVALPAIATALLSARNLYQYETTQYLFDQTYKRLDELSEMPPDPNDPDLAEKVKAYIQQAEEVIAAENQQWLSSVAEAGAADDGGNSANAGG